MEKRNILYAALLTAATQAWGQDPVHGVDGYYNWTPARLKVSGVLSERVNTNNGFKGGEMESANRLYR